jgi:hypothetical protein
MFKVKPFDAVPLRWWYEQWLDETIDMLPPYQRKAEIWSKWKQAHLIDSILNGFDIPKFYVAGALTSSLEKMNPHAKRFAVIDGKQRLGAIFSFFKGHFPLNPTFVFEDDPKVKLAGKTYLELKTQFPHIAERLDSFVPAMMNVITDDPHKIDELFVRLNSGEATTGSERRNAKQGPVPAIIRELVLHPFFQKKIRFNTQRMQEYNLAAKLLLIETVGKFVDTKSKNLDDFADNAAKWSEENSQLRNTDKDPYATARDQVYSVLDRLAGEFLERDILLASQGHIPVYYWFARENPRKVNEFRDFLASFTEEVKTALAEQREDPKRADPELMSYYTMGRTTNDQASLEGRYKILLKRFKVFRDPHVIARRR